MADYTFETLSSVDFERLVRDLLQEEWRVTLESFATGRDEGIDLRYSRLDTGDTIVQCKHYVRSGFSALLGNLRKETKKVAALDPGRYVIATSVRLTPLRKRRIRKLFPKDVLLPADILGRDDLNNLLGKYPSIEKNHPKLWLASTPILERILHADVFTRSKIATDRIPDLHVPNASLDEAKQILSDLHYCVIAGVPGIGKTMLAEFLAAEYIGAGYRFTRITGNISEALRSFNPYDKQIFHYDDFLGQTTLQSKLGKNEDADLLAFLAAIKKASNSRFLLTTREYILNQAKEVYEQLHTSRFDWKRCTIDLESYTRMNRAEILFNHIYFSDLPESHRMAFLESEVYLKIVDHKNYSPRIVSWMTVHLDSQEVAPDDYVDQFLLNLDNPKRLWEHAFEKQLSTAAQHLLLVLMTMPPSVSGNALEAAFRSFFTLRAKKYGWRRGTNDFRTALRELDENFIATYPTDGNDDFAVQFHNPSIRDYLEARLRDEREDVSDLLNTATSFEQVYSLIEEEYVTFEEAWGAVLTTISKKGVEMLLTASSNSYRRRTGLAERARALLVLADLKENPGRKQQIGEVIELLKVQVREGSANVFELERLLNDISDDPHVEDMLDEDFLSAVTQTFLHEGYGLRTFKRLLRHQERFPDAVKPEDLQAAREYYSERIRPEVDEYAENAKETDPDELEQYRDDASRIAQVLGVEMDDELSTKLDDALEASIVERESYSPDDNYEGGRSTPSNEAGELDDQAIRDMFDALR